MFSWILTVKTNEEWMWTRIRNGTLTLQDSDFIETMGYAFKETYSPRVPVGLTYIVVCGELCPIFILFVVDFMITKSIMVRNVRDYHGQ